MALRFPPHSKMPPAPTRVIASPARTKNVHRAGRVSGGLLNPSRWGAVADPGTNPFSHKEKTNSIIISRAATKFALTISKKLARVRRSLLRGSVFSLCLMSHVSPLTFHPVSLPLLSLSSSFLFLIVFLFVLCRFTDHVSRFALWLRSLLLAPCLPREASLLRGSYSRS